MPGSWGLKGKTYKRAKAEYELVGEKLETELILIEHGLDETGIPENPPKEFLLDFAKHKLSTGKITKEEYDYEVLEYKFDDNEQSHRRELELELDFRYHRITLAEYKSGLADIEGVPFVCVSDSGFDWEEGPGGFWQEFEWNQEFIDFLRENGYEGASDQDMIDGWLSDLYRSHIMESEMGEMDIPDDDENFKEVEFLPERNVGPDGKIVYS